LPFCSWNLNNPSIIFQISTAGSGRYGVSAVIVIGALGYVIIWWKGWKLSDMMFVTRRGFSDACTRVGKQLELVSSSIATAKKQLSSKIDLVDSNVEECKEIAAATKFEVRLYISVLRSSTSVSASGLKV
ncbi:hypothetical protein BHE74_00011098, partial [Ensete ventricosum]